VGWRPLRSPSDSSYTLAAGLVPHLVDMKDSRPTQQQAVDDDWQVELSDLDRLQEKRWHLPAWAAQMLRDWRIPRHRRRLRKISNAGLLFVIVLVIALLSGNDFFALVTNGLHSGFGLFPQSSSHPAVQSQSSMYFAAPLEPVRGQDKLACLLDAQWSPNGDAIAVLGYQYACPGNHNEPGILNVYNARTGKLIAQWQPDDTVLNIINAPSPKSPAAPSVGITAISSYGAANSGSQNAGSTRLLPFSYMHVMWSPNEQQLAISFFVYFEPQPAAYGVLIMNVNGGSAHVIFQPPNLPPQTPVEWDISEGQALGFTNIPPALTYRWGTRGRLAPDALLSDNKQKQLLLSGAIGNPDGNVVFAIWQPGNVTLSKFSGLFGWSTNFAAWSPDGRYLIDGISMQGLFEPPGSSLPDAQTLSKLKSQQYSLLPPHDVALLEVAAESQVVSWRPDGRVLAALTDLGYVLLFDCQTGYELGVLNQHPLIDTRALLRWSPDGSHLLLSSAQDGVMRIWGPEQLLSHARPAVA